MEKKNDFYADGIEYAINQMYSKGNEVKKIADKIKETNGNEASSKFLDGYYKGLTYFIHAMEHVYDNEKNLEERIKYIEEINGEDLKKAFIMGLNYYKVHQEELEIYRRRK